MCLTLAAYKHKSEKVSLQQHLQCISMISSRFGKTAEISWVVRSSSLSRGLEKTAWRTLSIRTWACSVANSSKRQRESTVCGKWKTSSKSRAHTATLFYLHICFMCCFSSLFFSSPLMTSCLLVSFLLRLDRASGEASSRQLGGSCSNSRRRGSTSSTCGDGLVGEWPGPSGGTSGPSTLTNAASERSISLDCY